MLKQPKYFYSKEKTPKPLPPLKQPDVATETVVLDASSRFARIRTYRTHILFSMAALTFIGLGILGIAPVIRGQGLKLSVPTINVPKLSSTVVSQSAPATAQGLAYDVKVADARVDIVESFLTRYKSPLDPADKYAKALVDSADKYGLDYRLLPAIMMQESNLCKTSKPELHNCLGFGIHARGELGFDTYEEGFDRAAKELKANYIDQGLVTPEQIMKKYTPSSNGSWASSVNQWIAEMEHNDRDKGIASETDANLLEYTAKK